MGHKEGIKWNKQNILIAIDLTTIKSTGYLNNLNVLFL